jgi:hypothetical protein
MTRIHDGAARALGHFNHYGTAEHAKPSSAQLPKARDVAHVVE